MNLTLALTHDVKVTQEGVEIKVIEGGSPKQHFYTLAFTVTIRA